MTPLRKAVERTTRALGLWRDRQQSVDRTTVTAGPDIVFRRDGETLTVQPRSYGAPVRVDELTAALWLLCHALPETRERCPDCERRGGGWEWAEGGSFGAGVYLVFIDSAEARWVESGWTVARIEFGPDHSARIQGQPVLNRYTRLHVSRPCPTCTVDGEPTGWVPRSWGAVLLGAMPRDKTGLTDAVRSTCSQRYLGSFGGNTDDREALAVLADELLGTRDPPCQECKGQKVVGQKPCIACARVCYCCGERRANGTCWRCSRDFERNIKCTEEPDGLDYDIGNASRQLGEWLALWLNAVPCRACGGTLGVDDPLLPTVDVNGAGGRHGLPNKMRCERCRGSGLELGAHEQVIVSALNNLCANLQKAPT